MHTERSFHLRPTIGTGGDIQITGIGGKRNPIGTMSLEIPLPYLDLVIEVDFLVLKEPVPKLSSMHDIILNGLDIYWQGGNVSLK